MDVLEAIATLRSQLLQDASFTSLLGETNGIYWSYPSGTKQKPIIVINLSDLRSQNQIGGVGVYRPSINFDIFTINPYDAGAIYTYLERNWDIPRSRQDPISSNNFRIDQLTFESLIEVTSRLGEVASGQVIRMFTIPVALRIVAI